MAVENLIKKGQDAIDEKDYLGAIQLLSQAIKENPKAFQAFLKRATAYQKLKNYDEAKKDISNAFTIANERGKRSDIGFCYFRLGLVYYQLKNLKTSLIQFQKAKQFDCKESTLDMWLNKCEYDLKNHPEWNVEGDDDELDLITSDEPNIEDDEEELKNRPKIEELGDDEEVDKEGKVNSKSVANTVSNKESKPESNFKNIASTSASTTKSTNIDVINKIAPLNTKIREDWYQTNNEVIITIYAKNIQKDSLDIQFQKDSLSISFPNKLNNSEYNYNLDPLFDGIKTDESSFKVFQTKLEIYLKKENPIKWSTLEKPEETSSTSFSTTKPTSETKEDSTPAYPTSSKKKINWNNFKIDDKDIANPGDGDFFKTLYKDMDDDQRRAMMKSYVQSNGTILTTSWEEAAKKEFETSPPEGMVAKKWSE
ncbi:SGT1 [Candida pseudojiufengensis]|uniref:SGT1 n=1 Tax=Candida pseudojiufengensis TaxID=497109 RepID=UPI002225253E|nr:SGT1 [Candida pseudojiufengensis]KAI5965245.1 SGT1 [Candida pseudojiufengensis]